MFTIFRFLEIFEENMMIGRASQMNSSSWTVTLSLLQGGVGRPQLVARRNSGIRLCGNSRLRTSKACGRSDHGVQPSNQIQNAGIDYCDPCEGKSFPAAWKNPGNEVLEFLNLYFKNIYIFMLSAKMGPFHWQWCQLDVGTREMLSYLEGPFQLVTSHLLF